MQECEGTLSVLPVGKAAVVTNSGCLRTCPAPQMDRERTNCSFPWSSWPWFGLDLDSWALAATVWQEQPSSPAFPEGLFYY